jgi:hypothetical protein
LLQVKQIQSTQEPNIIIEQDAEGCSATFECVQTEKQMKAHFKNIMPISLDTAYNRVHENFDDDTGKILSLFPDKTT